MHRRRAPKTGLQRRGGQRLKAPGGPPLTAQQQLYIRLVAQGTNNSAACRTCGINRKTGTRWSNGRVVRTPSGHVRTYPSITRPPRPSAISARFLSERERLRIADGLIAGQSLRSIAKELGRSPSTIAREVANNADPATGRYRPYTAQHRSESRRQRHTPAKFVANPELARYVQAGLDKRWSPEQISNALVGDFPERSDMRACHETIYQALYNQQRAGLHRNPVKALRSRRARRKRRRRPEERRSRFGGPMTMICDRPSEVADRSVPGHWEGDLIMGRGNQSAIGTLVERTTRFLKLVHLPGGHSAGEMKEALVKAMSSVPAHLARSLTWDQGSELGCHEELTRATGMPVYFCNPASPWQRGTNENTNGLVRQYFPKGTDLRAHGLEKLEAVSQEFNSRPRKTLGWRTPADCFQEHLKSSP